MLLCIISNRTGDTGVAEEREVGLLLPRPRTQNFLCSKNKNGKQKKKKEFQSRNYENALTKVKMLLF